MEKGNNVVLAWVTYMAGYEAQYCYIYNYCDLRRWLSKAPYMG